MSSAQPLNGKILFATESLDSCFCIELTQRLRGEGFEIIGAHSPGWLIPLYYQHKIGLILVFGDGHRMFRAQMEELMIADNTVPVVYLHSQPPEGSWPKFVTFLPWPCEYVQATADTVLQMAGRRCHILAVPTTHLD